MFKAGDRVVCVEGNDQPFLVEGRIYVVDQVTSDRTVRLVEFPDVLFLVSRFSPVAPDLGVTFRLRVEEFVEYTRDGGKTWFLVPSAEELRR